MLRIVVTRPRLGPEFSLRTRYPARPKICLLVPPQRWTDSLLLRFMIHLDSQDDCDDSIELDSFFPGCSKETRFPIPNYISIEVNGSTHDSFRAMATWSRFNSIQFNHELQCKMLQIHPICTFASSPPQLNLANQLQSSQLIDVAGTSE